VWQLGARTEALRRQEIRKEVDLVTHQAAAQLRYALDKHLVAQRQLANFFENSERVTSEEFEDFASTTFELTAGIVRLSVADPAYRVRWVYPEQARPLLLGFDIRSHPEGYATVLRAAETRGPALSPPLRLLDGGQGLLLALPILKGGAPQGFVVATFRSEEFFSSTAVPEVLGRYDQTVLAAGVEIFRSDAAGSQADGDLANSEEFVFGGTTLEVRLRPRPEVVDASLGSGLATFWILGSLLSLCAAGAAGAVTWWVGSLSKRVESKTQALQETRQRLDGAMQQLLQAEKIAALGELVAGVAHEMNNPLCSIMGYSQLLLSTESNPEKRSRLETVFSEAGRMAKIVRNLLSFARKQPPERKYLGLNGVVEKTLELKAYHFRTHQIRVEKELDPELPKTMLDFHQVQQVLINLFNNAEQAMISAGRGKRLRVRTRRRGDRIELEVEDDGPGIPREIQHRIFEPFFTTKTEGKGTGLGLSLCYGIVKEHGGSIKVHSLPGSGATFVVELPVLEGGGEAVGGAPAVRSLAAPPLRILIVDDELGVQNFLADVLGSRGHKVDTASDVPEAARKIHHRDYDVILSDMKMPSGSGGDVHESARRRSADLARRIVFMTGDEASDDTRRFLAQVGNETVGKPFRLEELDAAIARVTGGRPGSPGLPAPPREGAAARAWEPLPEGPSAG
jgi:signal transduction histidine kinase/ActR/RegA family two-component response regulator